MTSAPAVEAAPSSEPLVASSEEDVLCRLMVEYQGGDAKAFGELFERVRGPLRAYILSLTRDASKADDLMQDTLLQLHRSRQTYRSPRPVLPWAFGIARHVFLMDRRAAGRRYKVFDPHTELPAELPVPAKAFGVIDRDALGRALGQIPEDRREVLLLHHLWGFSFSEIGQILGIRAGAAKVRSHRGMSRLRQLLGAEDHE